MLAPRNVHFAKDQVWWDCAAGRACETFPQGRDPTKLGNFEVDLTFWDPQRPLPALDLILVYLGQAWRSGDGDTSRSLAQMANSNNGEIGAAQWQRILCRYSQLGLSRSTDRLVAIGGIAQAVQSLRNVPESDYAAGLWKSDFPDCLLWQSRTSNTVCSEYVAPSWSWASTTGSVSYRFNSSEGETFTPASTLVERCATVLDAWVDNDLHGRLGQVTSGQLSIAAPIYNIELRISSEKNTRYCSSIRIGHCVFDHAKPSRHFQPYLDHTPSYEKALATDITICAYFCKINVFEHSDHPEFTPEFKTQGLLLERVRAKKGTYRRIGTLHWSLCLPKDEFIATQKDLTAAQLIDAEDYINDLGEGRFEIIIICYFISKQCIGAGRKT